MILVFGNNDFMRCCSFVGISLPTNIKDFSWVKFSISVGKAVRVFSARSRFSRDVNFPIDVGIDFKAF